MLPGLAAVTRTAERLCSRTVAPCHTRQHVHNRQRQSTIGFFRTNGRVIRGRAILSRLYSFVSTSCTCMGLTCRPPLFEVSAPMKNSPCDYFRWWVWTHLVTASLAPIFPLQILKHLQGTPPFPFASGGTERTTLCLGQRSALARLGSKTRLPNPHPTLL